MDHTKLIRHHVSISLPDLIPAQLAFFSFPESPKEVRLHFWIQDPQFPAKVVRFCTHLDYEHTASYDSTPSYMLHNPEQMTTEPPSQVACGTPTRFILGLNRAVWEEFQKPVPGLMAIRIVLTAKIKKILEKSLEDSRNGTYGDGTPKFPEGRDTSKDHDLVSGNETLLEDSGPTLECENVQGDHSRTPEDNLI